MLDRDLHDAKEVLGEIRNLDSKTKRKMISGLQRMHQESESRGMVKGMEQGVLKGKKEIATQMIRMELDAPVIAEATGLSTKEIDQLQSQHNCALALKAIPTRVGQQWDSVHLRPPIHPLVIL